MKVLLKLLLVSCVATVSADCPPETEISLDSAVEKVTVNDYEVESVNRFAAETPGSKVVLRGYATKPIVSVGDDGILTITSGEPCGEPSSAFSIMATLSPLIMANSGLVSPLTGFATLFLMGGLPYASAAEDGHDHDDHSITIDIYTDVNELVHKQAKSMTCPPESFHYEHHPTVHGGYAGCVGEKYLLPCGQDAQGASDSSLYSKTPINWNATTGECFETGYTYETRTFWILWGDPLDKHELLTRTGLKPTVTFPLERGPYPAYTHGTDETTELYDDASSAKALAKDFLVYLGAIPESEKTELYVSMTEGAEQGIQILWAAMALDIAKTTCNRDIYVLMEVPAYGYNNGEVASWVNTKSGDFYEGEECLCYPNCKEPTVTVNNVGFFPPNIPSRLGGDNITYSATSSDPKSPWFESMVFPENPSGRIKIPQNPNPLRRVCDGVYVWPMYFYFNDFEIPLSDKPDCAGWAYATTKGFSASIRTGFITYKQNPDTWVEDVSDMMKVHGSLGMGSYSEWSWMGQMQLQTMIMSKPLTDPTSWVGAYGGIMKEKWDVVKEGFENCPVVDLTNHGQGAYAFFLYKAPYLGLQNSWLSSFFLDVLGVSSTTYRWGFRGADPSEYYGDGVGIHDFTRMQLYRDVNVYIEVARRAKIVCADTSASIGDFISIDDWKLKEEGRIATMGTRRAGRHLRESMSHLTEKQLDILEHNEKLYADYDEKAESCAGGGYTTSCFYDKIGKRHADVVHIYDENEEFVSLPLDKHLRG